MKSTRRAAASLAAWAIFALLFAGGCTTMRKTLDAIIEGRGEGEGGGAVLASAPRPARPAERGRPWAY